MGGRKINSEIIKKKALELGADLVGICSSTVLNENPPDPRWPQTPVRIWSECRSVIALGKRVPWGLLRADNRTFGTYPPHLVISRLDNIALDLTYFIEEMNAHACMASQQVSDEELKNGSYGPLSLRHVAIEAGLGTLGLNMSLLTPEFGPRVYVTAVLTDVELECETPQTKQLCLGPSCGRCLLACPSDAVEHWGLDKKKCSQFAQTYGISSFIQFLHHILQAETKEERNRRLSSLKIMNFWQALRTGSMSYAGCLKCLQVCPVGQDFPPHLKDKYGRIDNISPEKEERRRIMADQELRRDSIGSFEHSRHWIGTS